MSIVPVSFKSSFQSYFLFGWIDLNLVHIPSYNAFALRYSVNWLTAICSLKSPCRNVLRDSIHNKSCNDENEEEAMVGHWRKGWRVGWKDEMRLKMEKQWDEFGDISRYLEEEIEEVEAYWMDNISIEKAKFLEQLKQWRGLIVSGIYFTDSDHSTKRLRQSLRFGIWDLKMLKELKGLNTQPMLGLLLFILLDDPQDVVFHMSGILIRSITSESWSDHGSKESLLRWDAP